MFGKLMLERMLRAAIASAAAYLAVGITTTTPDSAGIKALAVGMFGAAVSACMTMVSQLVGDPNSTSFTKATVEAPQ
jgi:hypothetical protein